MYAVALPEAMLRFISLSKLIGRPFKDLSVNLPRYSDFFSAISPLVHWLACDMVYF